MAVKKAKNCRVSILLRLRSSIGESVAEKTLLKDTASMMTAMSTKKPRDASRRY
jgi:hypothetical protein